MPAIKTGRSPAAAHPPRLHLDSLRTGTKISKLWWLEAVCALVTYPRAVDSRSSPHQVEAPVNPLIVSLFWPAFAPVVIGVLLSRIIEREAREQRARHFPLLRPQGSHADRKTPPPDPARRDPLIQERRVLARVVGDRFTVAAVAVALAIGPLELAAVAKFASPVEILAATLLLGVLIYVLYVQVRLINRIDRCGFPRRYRYFVDILGTLALCGTIFYRLLSSSHS